MTRLCRPCVQISNIHVHVDQVDLGKFEYYAGCCGIGKLSLTKHICFADKYAHTRVILIGLPLSTNKLQSFCFNSTSCCCCHDDTSFDWHPQHYCIIWYTAELYLSTLSRGNSLPCLLFSGNWMFLFVGLSFLSTLGTVC